MRGSFAGLRTLFEVGERLERNSIPEPNSGCRLWTACISESGYGSLTVGRVGFMAHRASWIASKGEIPNGLHVLHRCDTRSCINPDHLFLGTNADNVADRTAKRRQPSVAGEANPRSKLSASDVAAICATAVNGAVLARRYGVTRTTISSIRLGKTWGGQP